MPHASSPRTIDSMSDRPLALIVRTAGTNCDAELVRAFELAGARAELLHVDRLVAEPALLDGADLIGFPGGFSYGDDIASGRMLAIKLRERLLDSLRAAVERGAPIIGVCNGFQVLAQVGLLPGVARLSDPCASAEAPHSPCAPRPSVALADNAGARFIDAWLGVNYPDSRCVWTRGLGSLDADAAILPIAHGEGRFIADDATLDALEEHDQVAVRYRDNPNGSMRAIAGISDPTGLILGLMPHPERFADWRQHPTWTRLDPSRFDQPTPGLRMFQNAVKHVAAVRV